MFGLVIVVHVIVCVLLIIIVLIQQGRGGGLIDSLSSAESIFGTKTNTFLVKSTSIFAVIFFVTCLSLAFFSIQKSKSLIETKYKQPAGGAMPFFGNVSMPAVPGNTTLVTNTTAAPTTESAPGTVAKSVVPEVQKTEGAGVEAETKK